MNSVVFMGGCFVFHTTDTIKSKKKSIAPKTQETVLFCTVSCLCSCTPPHIFVSGVVFLGGLTRGQQMCLTMERGDHDHPMKSNSAVTFNKISTLGSSSIEESLVDVSRQSCKMSQICQICLCKNIGKLG